MPEQAKKHTLDILAEKVFGSILVVFSLLITLIITGAALARYVFKFNFVGYDEFVVILAFWFYFTGAAYGAYNNSHVSADLVDAYAPEGTGKRVLHVARWFLTSAACGLFVYYGFNYIKFSFMGPLGNFQFQPKSMTWRIPHWVAHAGIFFGLILMEVYFLRNLAQSVKALYRGDKA
ncbi:MAG: TRAP transporter small permease [Synergistaceae bacterium]|jgi:TRAP-type C4-dicarboxylate transport system permease small subunit|nr:TRAP transporter small permease [Synergistaceae bacterium]